MQNIKERLEALREAMKQQRIAAFIIPGTDPHASEYITEHWQERVWISGFTGSAGTVVVTQKEAGLWTDSRYFLQADIQLKDTGIELFKAGLPDTPSINAWLVSVLKKGERVAVNPEMFSVRAYAEMSADFEAAELELVPRDFLKLLWHDRPGLPIEPFFVLDTEYAGRTVGDKLAQVRSVMDSHGADVCVFSALDDIAWLLNIRGTDVDFNPVVISYAMVEKEHCTLFIAPEKLTAETVRYVVSNKIAIADYENIYSALKSIQNYSTVMYDGTRLNRALYDAIPASCRKIDVLSPVQRLKSIKNETELKGIRQAMLSDGVALARFFIWLEQNVAKGHLTECDIMTMLKGFRAEDPHFMGESFGTIAGYGPNGAIVHYAASDETCATLQPDNLLLLDSGGQYLNGTTDITRTVCLGQPTEQQKHDFTLVLKGHIALARARFPKGTRGSQLDILAHQFLWQEGLHYGHGTGHGVGHFLCVHEGPQNIRMDENPTVLEPGMVISDEPGIYRTGEYGIRTENLVTVVEDETNDFASFLKFETLTLCPYDHNLIDTDMLNQAEKDWINAYHKRVYDSIAPLLNKDEQNWLKLKCAEI